MDERGGIFEAEFDFTSAKRFYIARVSRSHMHSRVEPISRYVDTSFPTASHYSH